MAKANVKIYDCMKSTKDRWKYFNGFTIWFTISPLIFQVIGVCLLALATCSFGAITKAPPTATQAPITINPKLRKALLEALSNYDGEDSTEAGDEGTTSSSEFYDDVTNRPFVKIHTFAVDGDKSNENEVIKTIIISRPRTTLTPPKDPSNDISERKDQVEIKFNKVPDPVSDRENEKTPNIQLVRSIESHTAVSGSEKKDEKPKKKASEKFFVTKPITPQITTTTLPPPVTNADGDNIEKVAKDDVKILQAPLLAAFTVSQDGNGQPKNIISLFKNPQPTNVNDDANAKRIINMEFKASQPAPSFSSAAPAPTVAPSTTIQVPTATTNQQLLTAFEFKQRQLEEQIRFLQAKQREQEEIIRRQQQLQEQQNRQSQFNQQNHHSQFDLNRQRERFEEDQRRQQFEEEQRQRERFNQEQNFLQRQQQAQALQQPQTQALQAPLSPSVNVQFIPSIPAGHTVGISVEQQLPFKGPSEFNPDKPEFQKSFGQSLQQFQFRQQLKQQQPFQQQVQQQNSQNQQQSQQNQQQLPTQQQQFQQQNQFQQSTQQQLFLQNPQNFQQPRNFGQQNQLPVAQPLIQQHQVRELQASPLPTNLELPVRQPQNFVQFSQLPTNLELPQRPFQTFNSAPLSVLPSLTDIVPQTQGRTRVFRNDASQTGNFGFNGGNVQIQQQQIDPINYSLDNQLQNLFRQSGINTRSTDDFGIISKILSLNHGVPNNLLFANSGRFR